MYFDKYTAEDFALLEEFRTWVLTPSRDSNIFWADWLEKHPDKLAVIEQARMLVEHVPFGKHSLEQQEFDSIVNHIEKSIDDHGSQASIAREDFDQIIPLNSYTITKRARNEALALKWNKWLTYAAAVAVLVASAFFFNQSFTDSRESSHQFITTESPRGQISLINLPDGSRVWLNAGSSIRYIEHFTETARDIHLQGEAYFEVARDTSRPFTVIAGNTATTALGTSFNINNYSDKEFIDIALLTGKVAVKKVNLSNLDSVPAFVLEPGEKASYSTVADAFARESVNTAKVLNWKNGIIQFENASFTEVKNTLERVYAIDIYTDNEISRAWSYNGYFTEEPLELVLRKLALTEDFTYILEKNKVRLQFNR